MCGRDHFVQFYDEDQTIVEAVAGYFAFGLRFREGCVLIGTGEHNAAIISALGALGCDVDEALGDGRLMVFDASETLSRFMVDGMPDANKFSEVIGKVIADATFTAKPPRAFGEMVAVLAEAGNAAAAVELEKLWNGLAKQHSFRLFCAYKQELLAEPAVARFTSDIRATHSHVVGLAPA
jgi:hypothetical protein